MPTGNFCVPIAVDGDCISQRPYVGALTGTTLDSSAPTALCVLRETTCPGLNDRSRLVTWMMIAASRVSPMASV
jgi:hypothetical protein